MKLKFKDNSEMKARRKMDKLRTHRNEVALWHRKYAWRPLRITTADIPKEQATVVWFEWVWQKAHVSDWRYRSLREHTWTRHPEKEYFKKKLDGTLEREEDFNLGSGDSMQNTSGPISSGVVNINNIGP